MIKFFRRIRQQLVSQNKLSKYLIYAIGEIILVVIGILIALQLNNLNESIKLNKEEQTSLYKLHKESEVIVESIKTTLSFKDSIINTLDRTARAFSENNYKAINTAELEYGLAGIGYYPAFDLPNSVYKELNSSGKLQNIKSEEVQNSITKFYANLEFITSQLSYFRGSAASLEIDLHTDPFLYVYDANNPTRNMLKVNLEALQADPIFKSRHIHGLRNQIVFKNYIIDLMHSAQAMCVAIAKELKITCAQTEG